MAEMFDRIAPKYDFMNRFLSAGIDVGWRKKAIKRLKADNPKTILDIATGTGDMAILACRILNPDKIEGIDISVQMLELGKKKIEKEGLSNKIRLQIGDSEAINFAPDSFDGGMGKALTAEIRSCASADNGSHRENDGERGKVFRAAEIAK